MTADDRPTRPVPGDDATQPLPTDDATQPVPTDDGTGPVRADGPGTVLTPNEEPMDPGPTHPLPADASEPSAATGGDGARRGGDADDRSGARRAEDRDGPRPEGSGDPHGATAADVTTRDDGLRVGTVVWGLVVAAIGVGLLAVAAGVEFDVQLAVIALVAVAGVGLLVGSLVTAARRRDR